LVNQLEISFGSPLRIVVAKEETPEIFSVLKITDGLLSVSAKGDVMLTLPIVYKIGLQVAYVDAGGNPAVVDGDVAWSSSDPTILVITVDPSDSTTCVITSTDNIGQVQVTAIADADLGSGVRQLTTLCDVTVVAGEAVAGTISPVGDAVPAKK
jgi:hypothetical protein